VKKKILVVDDEILILKTYQRDLELAGYEVDTADSGEDALLMLAQTRYDLLVTDLMMNGMSGIELLAGAGEKNALMPVVILTGHGHLQSAMEALRLGAADYLLKPCINEELILRITSCLEKTELRQEVIQQKKAAEKIKEQAEALTEANIALKVLLKQSEQTQRDMEEKITANIHDLILPNLTELEIKASSSPELLNHLEIIKKNLQSVTSPFALKLTSKKYSFSPRELQIADLIRMGKTTKEIAQLLKISYGTVETFRDKIRVKLDIKNKKINLRTHLISHSTESGH
jgi:DNA-binding NarL/FixJ family response regulator